MHKLLLAAALALAATTASAQSMLFWLPNNEPLPQTKPMYDKNGTLLGTATFSGNMLVFRDAKGELIGSSRISPDGTHTFYDPNGKVIGSNLTKDGLTIYRDSEGKIIGEASK